MLTLYKRHTKSCAKKDRLHGFDKKHGLCSCPCWVEGVTDAGQYIRKSLKVSSKEKGEPLRRKLESGDVQPVKSPSISEASEIFLTHLAKKNISPATIRKFQILLSKFPNVPLNQLDVPALEKMRNNWMWGPLTSAKYIERLRRFFTFAAKQKWLIENPALELEMPKLPQKQVAPFEPDEVAKIEIEASENPRHYALVLLLRYSGLRIADAVMLQRRRLKDSKLFLYTAKTGAPVWLPLPDHVVHALESCPNKSTQFFFCTGEGKKQTAVNNWRDDLAKLFKRAGVEGAHPHRYRHTLAAALLEKGVPVSEVAMILGNTPRIIEKHYAGWNRARQLKLESLVTKTWAKPSLVRVK